MLFIATNRRFSSYWKTQNVQYTTLPSIKCLFSCKPLYFLFLRCLMKLNLSFTRLRLGLRFGRSSFLITGIWFYAAFCTGDLTPPFSELLSNFYSLIFSDNYLFDVPEEEFISMKLTNKLAQQIQVIKKVIICIFELYSAWISRSIA